MSLALMFPLIFLLTCPFYCVCPSFQSTSSCCSLRVSFNSFLLFPQWSRYLPCFSARWIRHVGRWGFAFPLVNFSTTFKLARGLTVKRLALISVNGFRCRMNNEFFCCHDFSTPGFGEFGKVLSPRPSPLNSWCSGFIRLLFCGVC